MPASFLDEPANHLCTWMRELPRAREAQHQFERRARPGGAQFEHALAHRWIDAEMMYNAIYRGPSYAGGGTEWPDIGDATVREADDAQRRMERAGAARFEDPSVGRLAGRLERAVAEGDGPAFRDCVAEAEWCALDARDWIEVADAFEAGSEPRAAEAFVTTALAMAVSPDGDRADAGAFRRVRGELRAKLRALMEQNQSEDR